MWNDSQLDLEELESRLYSQVHHFPEDAESAATADGPSNEAREDPSPRFKRYFENRQSPYHKAYFNNPINAPQPPTMTYENYYNHMGMFPFPGLNPVNNIVVLPPTHASIITQSCIEKEARRMRLKQKRKDARKKKRILKERERANRKRVQLENEYLRNTQRLEEPQSSTNVICVSASDGSDCEVKELNPPPLILIESSDEDATEIKPEELKPVPDLIDEEKNDDDDDDVIFVKPEGLNEVITINCDEQLEPPELLGTPESTNDFLDNVNLSRTDVDSDGNDISSMSRSYPEVCEDSESSCSATDYDSLTKSAIFAEHEFDGASKEISELNLDTFTNYIASKGQNCGMGLILTSPQTLGKNGGGLAASSNVGKNCNSSDSSSESDYEDSKVELIAPSKKKDQIKANLDSDREALPNLSPINSDGENEHRPRKAEKIWLGEKRKSNQTITEEISESKRTKKDEDEFFSSSDDCSDFVIIDETSNLSTVELVNLETSTPKKTPQETSSTSSGGFANYWTDDMKKFYGDSWGHEDFSVEEELKAMSDDPKLWRIIEQDRINMNLLPREPRCRRCREFGHRLTHCRKVFGPPKCFLCGETGHFDSRCPNKMCTSCGRRSQYSTTYCSRCANSRHLKCSICSMRGHTSSHCPDLWRRYHLTTKEGPALKKPTSSSVKLKNNRWCSGCGFRGHFEYDCNYYNRTHPPANPFVRSYDNVYDDSIQRAPEQQFSGRIRENFTCIDPPQSNCEPNVPAFQHDLNSLTHGLHQKFYQNLSLFESLPSPFVWQQNLNNQPMCQSTSNEFQGGVDVPELDKTAEPPATNLKKVFNLRLNISQTNTMLSRKGAKFIKKISKNMNVNIQMRKKKKKRVCVIQGAAKLISKAKELILDFCLPSNVSSWLEIFAGRDFDTNVLDRCISNLDNMSMDWTSLARTTYKKIRLIEKKLQIMKYDDTLEVELKRHYVALNAVLLGNASAADGNWHMKVLRDGNAKLVSDEKMRDSYDYVFKSCYRLDINYINLISSGPKKNLRQELPCPADLKINRQLPVSVGFKNYLRVKLQAGLEKCEKINDKDLLMRLKMKFEQVIESNYSDRMVENFKQLCRDVK